MTDLSDRAACITGAGSGIGRAMRTTFAARGADIVCVDIDGSAADETAASIEAGGGRPWPSR